MADQGPYGAADHRAQPLSPAGSKKTWRLEVRMSSPLFIWPDPSGRVKRELWLGIRAASEYYLEQVMAKLPHLLQ